MKFFVIAGEASGDALGAALMAGLKALAPGVQFEGVGGPLMEAEGLVSRFPMEELSVMGLWEVLPKYRALKRRIAETAAATAAARPDALITIDSPDFCLRVARAARDALPDLRTIHYVAPSVWAWRPGRAAKMAPFIDHVLALLPFEPPYMTAAGMSCDFVGHPVVTEPRATPAEAAAFRETQMIGPEQPLVLCLPGSRRGEVARLGPRFDEALMRLRDREPGLRVVLPTVRGVAGMVREMTARWPVAPIVVETAADKRAAFAAADLALAASGTVSLELAAARVPMVIGYDMAPLSRIVISRLLRTDTVTLVNLVSETRTIPEFVGSHCRPGPMAAALLHLLEDDGARAAQLAAMELTMQRLGEGGEAPGLRAARSVLAALQGGKTRGRRHRTPGVFGR
jgi:lipid-A-disaccharide synthase